MLKFKFKFEQRRKVGLIRVETAPINRWDYYKNLGVGIIAFGLLFNPVEFLEKLQKKEKEKGHCATGPEQPQCTGPEAIRPRRAERRAHARFEPDGRGPGGSEREGGEGEERLTGGARLSSPTS